MTESPSTHARRSPRWRIAVWGGAALILLIPAVAMQFSSEVNWGPEDFATIGAMLLAACAAFELTMWLTPSRKWRAVIALAIVAAFLLLWVELAVGIFGPG